MTTSHTYTELKDAIDARMYSTDELKKIIVENARVYGELKAVLADSDATYNARQAARAACAEIHSTATVITREQRRREILAKNTPAAFAELVKFEASRMRHDLERSDRRAKFVSRSVEVIALDKDHNRIADAEMIEVPSRVSGKQITDAVRASVKYYGDACKFIAIEGGFDEFESHAAFFASCGDDYTPGVAYWSFTIPVESFKL